MYKERPPPVVEKEVRDTRACLLSTRASSLPSAQVRSRGTRPMSAQDPSSFPASSRASGCLVQPPIPSFSLLVYFHCPHSQSTTMSDIHKTPEVELGALGEPQKRAYFNDESDMRRMGKRQELQVSYSHAVARAVEKLRQLFSGTSNSSP